MDRKLSRKRVARSKDIISQWLRRRQNLYEMDCGLFAANLEGRMEWVYRCEYLNYLVHTMVPWNMTEGRSLLRANTSRFAGVSTSYQCGVTP
jgi:hypothetical protein